MFRKTPSAVAGILLVMACLAQFPSPASAQQPVVVELFTSEGCSDCPPADALLAELSRQRIVGNTELVLLEEHVEYWNQQGWIDRFSSPEFTQRQADYIRQLHLATPYTPQRVVDGHLQGVGNNPSAVRSMIAEASTNPKPSTVTLHWVSRGKLKVIVDASSQERQRVLLAITEDGLTTNVHGGENGGRVLNHNAVVRNLKQLGNTADGKFETTVNLPSKSDWKTPSLRAIVLVQNPTSGVILGAASAPYPPPGSSTPGR